MLLPTRELAVQVHEVLAPLARKLGLHAVAVYGGADIDRQVAKLRKGVDVIIATPGRLIDLGDRGEVSVEELETLVLDEADRMADMGFMPQVEWVLRRLDRRHQTLLFSATLDGAVDMLVQRYLNEPVFHEVASSSQTVTAMEHRFLQVHQMDKVKVVAAICRAQEKSLSSFGPSGGPTGWSSTSSKEGVRAAAIHGDLRQANRERALADFSNGKLPVLVATDVAARGLHIERVDGVIHYDPPEDHKAYLHRSGRTARAGKAGVVVSLALWNQLVEMEVIQRRLGLRIPIVEMFSNDPRLADLAAWTPAARGGRALTDPSPSALVARGWGPPCPGGHRASRRRGLRVGRHGGRLHLGRRGGDLLHRHGRRRGRLGPCDVADGHGGAAPQGATRRRSQGRRRRRPLPRPP